jgi:hypothetical protein
MVRVLLIIFAVLVGGFGFAVRDWAFKIKPEPSPLTAAELAANGPGANRYVRITDYEIGEPIIQSYGGTRFDVWLPVYPAGKAKDKGLPPIVFLGANVGSKEKDQLKNGTEPLEGIVGNAISGLLQKPGKSVLAKYPGLSEGKAWCVKAKDGPFRELAFGSWIAAASFAALGLLSLLVGPSMGRPPTHALAGEEVSAALLAGGAARAKDRWTPMPNEALAVRCYAGQPGQAPKEVLALGKVGPLQQPSNLFTITKANPILTVLLGFVLIVIAAALISVLPLPRNPTGVLFLVLLAVLGAVVVILPFVQKETPPAYVLMDAALVLVRDYIYTLIPWSAFRQLNFPRTAVVADGQAFDICPDVANFGEVYDMVQQCIRRRLMPPALANLEAGGYVDFKPFQVGAAAIAHSGEASPWNEVSSIKVTTHVQSQTRTLTICRHGKLLPWCRTTLNKVPNYWLLLEIITRVCPAHLLVTAKQ